MRSLILDPRQALYTKDLADPESVEGSREIYTELKNNGKIRIPVYVMRFSEFRGRYALFDGNRRTKAAELRRIPIRALEIECQKDFQVAQADQPTSWHRVDEEDFLKFNGEYFYKDIGELKQRGLLLSAYHRARKRIRDAVRKFYSWL